MSAIDGHRPGQEGGSQPDREPDRTTRRRWLVIGLVGLVVTVGVLAYLRSPDRDMAPIPALRQLDLLYLDEPAPGLDPLGVEPGTPAVIVFCTQDCTVPELDGAQVVLSGDPALAERYALRTSDGRVGPGYALVDPQGQLRYRTFDPAPGEHAAEIQVLVDAVRIQMRRDYAGAGVLVLAEAYLYGRYAQLDAEFHYWLHGLLGAALGLSALAAAVLMAGRRRAAATAPRGRWLTPWEAAGLGHLYAGFPDILFLTFGLPHDYWMDAFGLHITVHFVPAPVLTALALFLLGLLAYGLGRSQRRGSAAAALGAGGLALVAAVALAPAMPTDIADLRADPRLASHHTPTGRDATGTSHQEH